MPASLPVASPRDSARQPFHPGSKGNHKEDFAVLGMFFFFFFSLLVLFIFTGGLQKTKFFATMPRVEMKIISVNKRFGLDLHNPPRK